MLLVIGKIFIYDLHKLVHYIEHPLVFLRKRRKRRRWVL